MQAKLCDGSDDDGSDDDGSDDDGSDDPPPKKKMSFQPWLGLCSTAGGK